MGRGVNEEERRGEDKKGTGASIGSLKRVNWDAISDIGG